MRPFALIGGAALASAIVILPMVLPPADTQRYYLGLVLTSLTLLPLIIRGASGTLDLFEPIIPISLLFGLSFGIRMLYIVYNPAMLTPAATGLLPFDDYLDRAAVLAIGTYLALLAGYFVLAAPIRVAPMATRRFHRGTWPSSGFNVKKLAVLIAASLISSVMRAGSGTETVTGTTSLIGIAAGFAHMSACILMLYVAAGEKRLWVRAVIVGLLLPMAWWQSIVFGSKAYVIQFFYIIIAAWHYERRRIRAAVFVLAAVVVTLIVFPIVNTARSSDPRGFERLMNATPGEYIAVALEGVLSRSTGIDVLALVMKYDVSAQLGNGAAYTAIPIYAFVPRAIWEDKPILNQGVQFGRILLAPGFEGQNLSASFGMFHVGDLYVTFGLRGMLIGMCLLGCFYRLVYKFFDPQHTADLGVKFVYILTLWNMVNGFEGDIPSTASGLLKAGAVWIVLKIWMNQPRPTLATRGRRPYPQSFPERLAVHPAPSSAPPASARSNRYRSRFEPRFSAGS